MICTGFPASTTNHFTSNSSLLGQRFDADDLHAQAAQITANGACRLSRQRRGQLLAQLNDVEHGRLDAAIGSRLAHPGDDRSRERFNS